MAEAYTLAPLYLAILLSYISTSCLHGFSYKASNSAGCTKANYRTKCFAVGSFERVLLSTVQATKPAINAAIHSTEYNRKRQYFKHRVSNYSNHVACLTMFRPLVNVHPNPGPTREKRNSVSRAAERPGCGVMLAVRNTINSIRRSDLECSAEELVCEIRPSSKRKLLIVVFYHIRPPDSKLDYLKELKKPFRLANQARFDQLVVWRFFFLNFISILTKKNP